MRELKFRAWDKNKKEMITDGIQYALICIHIENDEDYEHHGVMTPSPAEYERFDIMQFTGLKDKNGQDIYEGDIVTGVVILFDDEYIGNHEIIFDGGAFCIKINGGLGNGQDYIPCLYEADQLEIEVIGNIYENPELLYLGV